MNEERTIKWGTQAPIKYKDSLCDKMLSFSAQGDFIVRITDETILNSWDNKYEEHIFLQFIASSSNYLSNIANEQKSFAPIPRIFNGNDLIELYNNKFHEDGYEIIKVNLKNIELTSESLEIYQKCQNNQTGEKTLQVQEESIDNSNQGLQIPIIFIVGIIVIVALVFLYIRKSK